MKTRSFLPLCLLAGFVSVAQSHAATTVLHYSVNDTDAATVAAGTVPGFGGSPNGTALGTGGILSASVPTAGVPASAGNRSLSFSGGGGFNLPGTQQLLNSDINANGGFTYEAWFNFAGGGNVNSIIDYAGTEKLVRRAAATGVSMTASGVGDPLIAAVGINEWHYAAVVFTSTGLAGADITGDFTFYFDGLTPVGTLAGQTIDDFGDSLNRTISVGAHPIGFAGDFYNGQIYEPRVSLGALTTGELLYTVPEPGAPLLLGFASALLFLRRRRS
ncbi:MAG: hypothetical protein ACI8XO_002521 [Verrucomicrobiales bacterium]|jgi:hypothetical protein